MSESTRPTTSSGRTRRERVDGVLWLDKPAGLSSNQALMTARRLLAAAKTGHGGTLDPMATGLLPLLFGEATKFAHDLLDADKTYLADILLGQRTDTGDREGQVIAQAPCEASADEVARVVHGFAGEIAQVPPMYSALKRDGKPLYAYAREGVTLEREARRVTIHAIEIVGMALPRLRVRVTCSKGTYIRTLAEDIGERLGCGAHLTDLRREAVAGWRVESACTLDALEALSLAARRDVLQPVDALIGALPRIDLDATLGRRFGQGQRLRVQPPAAPEAERPAHAARMRVYTQGRLLGVAALEDGVLVPQRLISMETTT